MDAIIKELARLLTDTQTYMLGLTEEQQEYRYAPGKWSRKEELGHLIDSAINNLQRFTEMQYAPQPYPMRGYKQEELVKHNAYHQADIKHLLQLWTGLNNQIILVLENMSIDPTKTLFTYNGETGNLKWMIADYVDHMKHHINQICHDKYGTFDTSPQILE